VRWWELAHELGMSVRELAARYALTLNAPLVVGVESVAQLEESVALASRDPLTPEVTAMLAESMTPLVDPEIVEPFRWTQGK
jgi:aryl-alcohol dehydrogenase-like predicted oxidoreductase